MTIQPALQLFRAVEAIWAVQQARSQEYDEHRTAQHAADHQAARCRTEYPGQQPGEGVEETSQARADAGVIHFTSQGEGIGLARHFGVGHLFRPATAGSHLRAVAGDVRAFSRSFVITETACQSIAPFREREDVDLPVLAATRQPRRIIQIPAMINSRPANLLKVIGDSRKPAQPK